MTPPTKGRGDIMALNTLAVAILLTSLIQSSIAGDFWHISDLHLDYFYSEGGDVLNWCHERTGANQTSEPGAGPAGEYSCDSPEVLVFSALEAMHKFQPKPDFIVWTGDSAPHWRDPAPPQDKYIMNVTKKVFRQIDKLFPGVPVVPALGNHDASPPDQFPTSSEGENKTDNYYTDLWRQGAFGDHIKEDGRETFLKCGYYSRVLKLAEAELRMIVLNTNIYYSDNFTEGPDPCDQLAWLNTTLGEASEPVFIVAHVPPGGFERGHGEDGMKINFNSPKDHAHDINQQLVRLLTEQQHAKKIQGQLYGHLHTDTFRLFLDSATRGEARGVGFMASSITPVVWGHHNQTESGVLGTNPSIRLFSYNDSDFSLLDYSQYSLDITAANKDDLGSRSKKKELVEKQSAKKELLENVHNSSQSGKKELVENVHNSRRQREVVQTTLPPIETTTAAEDLSETGAPLNNSSTESETTLAKNPTPPNTLPNPATTPSSMEVASDATERGVERENVERLVAQWKLLYKATTAFKVPDISPTSMFQAVKKMVASGAKGSLFQAYYRLMTVSFISNELHRHNTAGHPTDTCNEECWRDQLCTITRLVETELNTCVKATGTEGFFYQSQTLSSVESNQASDTTTITIPASVTTAPETESGTDHISSVTNDNDNLTLPPLDGTTPVVDIELEVSTSPPIRVVNQPKVEPVPEDEGAAVTQAVSTVLGLLGVLLLCLLCALGYKRYKDRRYRNQEFLLTDSVFRYDGYSQLDDD